MISFKTEKFVTFKEFARCVISKWACHYVPMNLHKPSWACIRFIWRIRIARVTKYGLKNAEDEPHPHLAIEPLIFVDIKFAQLEVGKVTFQMEVQSLHWWGYNKESSKELESLPKIQEEEIAIIEVNASTASKEPQKSQKSRRKLRFPHGDEM